MIEVGDPLPDFAVEIRDAAGALAAPGALAVTLTLPDLSTTPITPANPSTGKYTGSYVTTQGGRHWARWVATGANASAHSQMWDVEPADPGGFLSLADAKQHLNIPATTTTQDDELRLYVSAVCDAVEGLIGPVGRRTVTETVYPSSGVLLLSTSPVVSLTSVTPYASVALSLGSFSTDVTAGIIRPLYSVPGLWASSYTVVYVAGRAAIPPAVALAARIILAHLWETQRGPAGLPLADPGEEPATFGLGFAVPNRALELLAQYRRAPAIA